MCHLGVSLQNAFFKLQSKVTLGLIYMPQNKRLVRQHMLKTINPFFTAMWADNKKSEIRYNDRDYQIEDILYLDEFDEAAKSYTGRRIIFQVTYILTSDDFLGLREGYLMLCGNVLEKQRSVKEAKTARNR